MTLSHSRYTISFLALRFLFCYGAGFKDTTLWAQAWPAVDWVAPTD